MAARDLAAHVLLSGEAGLKAVPYDATRKAAWDDFVRTSRNGLFLYHRDYLEYHADRFPDASLMFYAGGGELIAILPATLEHGRLSSHAGLTFGGVVSDGRMRVPLMLDIFGILRRYAGTLGVQVMAYKPAPHIYQTSPADEDLYALYIAGARLVRRDVSSTIFMEQRIGAVKARRAAARAALRYGVWVERSVDFGAYFAIVEHVLRTKYGYRAVHTPDEMALLAGRFPDNIKLFAAFAAGVMQAGVIIYESRHVAHAQYIAASDEGKRLCALDAIINYLLDTYYAHKRYFDFGISTEREGRYLNRGMIDNKEGFGARAVVHDWYEIPAHEAAPA